MNVTGRFESIVFSYCFEESHVIMCFHYIFFVFRILVYLYVYMGCMSIRSIYSMEVHVDLNISLCVSHILYPVGSSPSL